MRAVLHTPPAHPEHLQIATTSTPVPQAGELLVRVAAAALNRADLLQRRGLYPPPPGASPILGLEVVGEVVHAVAPWHVGDRVMAVITGGGYAEYVCVPAAEAMAVPVVLSSTQAAALPEAFLTAWLNLVILGRLQAGEHMFIHAGASGVGSAAIQLAKDLGATVATAASTPAKQALCRQLGATYVYTSRSGALAAQVRADLPHGVDVILDMLGAPAWADNCDMLARGGRMLLLGFLAGSRGELDLGPILTKSLTITGTTLRRSPVALRQQLAHDVSAWLLPRVQQGRVVPVLDRVFSVSDVAEAHRYMESNANAGKIVLDMQWSDH
jgi:putative PIG3 family NAD(P)H quinone oxidoreductase